jgi:hypothetical protein
LRSDARELRLGTPREGSMSALVVLI